MLTPPSPYSLSDELLCFLPRIVLRVHVSQRPWPHGAELNDGFLFRVAEVCLAGTEGVEAARRQGLGLGLISGLSVADLERS